MKERPTKSFVVDLDPGPETVTLSRSLSDVVGRDWDPNRSRRLVKDGFEHSFKGPSPAPTPPPPCHTSVLSSTFP